MVTGICLALILFAHKLLSKDRYSGLLVALAIANAIAMFAFHLERPVSSAENLLHWIIVALVQYGILSLSLKIWLSINYKDLNPTAHQWIHVLSHGALLFVLVGGYWLKSNHPVVLAMVYPLSSLSIARIAEAIEEQLAVPQDREGRLP
jgi:hypothetical protein